MESILEFVIRVVSFIIEGLALLGHVILRILCHFVAPTVPEIRSTFGSIIPTFTSLAAIITAAWLLPRLGAPAHLHWAVSFAVAAPINAAAAHYALRVPWRASWIIGSLFHACFALVAFLIALAF